jgi:hypothetical protein
MMPEWKERRLVLAAEGELGAKYLDGMARVNLLVAVAFLRLSAYVPFSPEARTR